MASKNPWRERVVVGVDGSQSSLAAARWAAAEAQLRGRGLTIAHAVLPPVATAGFGTGIPTSLDLIDSITEAAEDQMRRIAADLQAPDVLVQVEVGSPSGVLLLASEEADLVVLGSRGHGGFAGLLLGSVGAQTASHSACPTIVVRGDAPADADEIIVGIDGSAGAEAALAFAFDEASRHGWTLVALHAWDVPAYDLLLIPDAPIPVPLADVADDEVRLAAEVLAGFRAEYPDVRVRERLARGPAVQSLLDASPKAAMIAVGTRGHGQAVGAVLGSVSHGVLHKARIPVAVVPRPAPEGDAA